mgnify:CR=1 FL=1
MGYHSDSTGLLHGSMHGSPRNRTSHVDNIMEMGHLYSGDTLRPWMRLFQIIPSNLANVHYSVT